MAKFEVLVVLLQLPLIVLFLHWHTASAAASVVTPRGRRSLDSRQLTAGGELRYAIGHVPAPSRTPHSVNSPAPGPSPTLYSVNSERETPMSPDHPPTSPSPPPPSPPPSSSPPPPPPQSPPPPPPPQEPVLCNYVVKTQTGTQWTAGTDSTISAQFYNKSKDSIYMVLTQGGLDTGHLDEFQIQGRCIRDICKMELFTDASGTLPCWYAEWVAVSVSSTTVIHAHNWKVSEWLPAHEWSSAGSLIRDDCYMY